MYTVVNAATKENRVSIQKTPFLRLKTICVVLLCVYIHYIKNPELINIIIFE